MQVDNYIGERWKDYWQDRFPVLGGVAIGNLLFEVPKLGAIEAMKAVPAGLFLGLLAAGAVTSHSVLSTYSQLAADDWLHLYYYTRFAYRHACIVHITITHAAQDLGSHLD